MRLVRTFAAVVLALLGVTGVSTAHAQLAPTEPFAAEIAQFETLDRAHPPTPGGIVFIGSSSIRKWTSLADDFPGRNAINRGFGGSKIADATRYAARIVTPYRPREVVLYAGDNDIADGADAARVLADFKSFVDAVRKGSADVPIVFVSIKPSPSRAQLIDTIRAANAAVRSYAATRSGVDYIDVFTPMLDASSKPRAELFGPDMLHMNPDGYALWVSIIGPTLR